MTTENLPDIKPRGLVRFRYLFAVLCMVGMSIWYSLKIAYITSAMHFSENEAKRELYEKNPSIGNASSVDPNLPSISNIYKYRYIAVMPTYFLGIILFAVPSGRLAELYSAKWIIVISISIQLILFAVTIQLYSLNNAILVGGLRMVQGALSSPVAPAMAVLAARWSPPAERSILCAITFCGTYLGGAMGYFAASLNYVIRREIVLFLILLVSILWLFFHIIYTQDYPQFTTHLSKRERGFILSSLGNQIYDPALRRKSRIPWKRIFESRPYLSLLIAGIYTRFIYHVTVVRILEGLETFKWKADMTDFSKVMVQTWPYFWGAVVAVTLGLLFSTLHRHGAMSKGGAVKMSTTVGMILPVILLTVDYIAGEKWELACKPLVIITLAGITNTVEVNHIEIAPNYAGTLLGITTALSQICPLVIHLNTYLFKQREYLIYLYGSTFVLSFVAILVFYRYNSTEVETWNQNIEDEEHD